MIKRILNKIFKQPINIRILKQDDDLTTKVIDKAIEMLNSDVKFKKVSWNSLAFGGLKITSSEFG